MSSHHIVREKQEPALLIMSLDGFELENLGQILEWSPTVIVHEEIYDLAESLAFKVDGVLTADPDFLAQENSRIILTDTDPLEDALKYLVGEKYPAVNIITRDFAIKDYALFVDDIDIVVFTEDRKIFPVRSGFSKWQPAGESLQILHEVNNLSTSGLLTNGDHTFQTEKDGFYSFTFDQPFIFIAESILNGNN
jgi:thiamine pyrophosphokinase